MSMAHNVGQEIAERELADTKQYMITCCEELSATRKELKSLKQIMRKLCAVTSDIIIAIKHCEQDPFANGVTHMGKDEGSVKGWEYFREREEHFMALERKYKELVYPVEDGRMSGTDREPTKDGE